MTSINTNGSISSIELSVTMSITIVVTSSFVGDGVIIVGDGNGVIIFGVGNGVSNGVMEVGNGVGTGVMEVGNGVMEVGNLSLIHI